MELFTDKHIPEGEHVQVKDDITIRRSTYFQEHYRTDEAYCYERLTTKRIRTANGYKHRKNGREPFVLIVKKNDKEKASWMVMELDKRDENGKRISAIVDTRKQAEFLGLYLTMQIDPNKY